MTVQSSELFGVLLDDCAEFRAVWCLAGWLCAEFSREGSQLSQEHSTVPHGVEEDTDIDKVINRYAKSAQPPQEEDDNQMSSPDSDGSMSAIGTFSRTFLSPSVHLYALTSLGRVWQALVTMAVRPYWPIQAITKSGCCILAHDNNNNDNNDNNNNDNNDNNNNDNNNNDNNKCYS